jgi:hypothetical protein
MPDLWPPDFGTANTETPPIVLLREQADLIATRTSGKIVGKVQSGKGGNQQFIHSLLLVAPLLDNYSFVLVSVSHPIELYPLEVVAREIIAPEPTVCRTPAEFEAALRKIFASERVRKVISAILAQSDAVTVGAP